MSNYSCLKDDDYCWEEKWSKVWNCISDVYRSQSEKKKKDEKLLWIAVNDLIKVKVVLKMKH